MLVEKVTSPIEQKHANTSSLRWWPHISAVLLVIVEMCWILPWFQMMTQHHVRTPRCGLLHSYWAESCWQHMGWVL